VKRVTTSARRHKRQADVSEQNNAITMHMQAQGKYTHTRTADRRDEAELGSCSCVAKQCGNGTCFTAYM
jgi:hypothetical protein